MDKGVPAVMDTVTEIEVGDLLGTDDKVCVLIRNPDYLRSQMEFRNNQFTEFGLSVERARELRDKLTEHLKAVGAE